MGKGIEIIRTILSAMIQTPQWSNLTLEELHEKLNDPVFLESLNSIFLILGSLNESQVLDFDLSFPLIARSNGQPMDKDTFLRHYRISQKDIDLISALANGVSLKNIEDELGISESWGSKRLGILKNKLNIYTRDQLFFVFGFMHLIPPSLDCLNQHPPSDEKSR